MEYDHIFVKKRILQARREYKDRLCCFIIYEAQANTISATKQTSDNKFLDSNGEIIPIWPSAQEIWDMSTEDREKLSLAFAA